VKIHVGQNGGVERLINVTEFDVMGILLSHVDR
jgi:hypothetical protein